MDTTLTRHLPVATCIGCGARSHNAECAEGCTDLPLDLIDVDDLVAIAARVETLEERVAELSEVARALAEDDPVDWAAVQERARAAVLIAVPEAPEADVIEGWGCPRCGRVDAPQQCLWICIRRPGLVADVAVGGRSSGGAVGHRADAGGRLPLQGDARAEERLDRRQIRGRHRREQPQRCCAEGPVAAVNEGDRGVGEGENDASAVGRVDGADKVAGGDQSLHRGRGGRWAESRGGGQCPGRHAASAVHQVEDAQVGAVDAEHPRRGGVDLVGGGAEVRGQLGDPGDGVGRLLRHSKQYTVCGVASTIEGL
jgi:hypothetical protein